MHTYHLSYNEYITNGCEGEGGPIEAVDVLGQQVGVPLHMPRLKGQCHRALT